jgi:putative oxidoreductase
MMKQLNRLSRFWYRPWAGLLLIRVALGLIFISHGWMKFNNVAGSVRFLGSVGVPEWLAYLVMLVEVVGGVMLIAGLFTRAAAVATGVVALFAFCLVKFPAGGLSGSELELLLAAGSFGIALAGSGRARLLHVFEHD